MIDQLGRLIQKIVYTFLERQLFDNFDIGEFRDFLKLQYFKQLF